MSNILRIDYSGATNYEKWRKVMAYIKEIYINGEKHIVTGFEPKYDKNYHAYVELHYD